MKQLLLRTFVLNLLVLLLVGTTYAQTKVTGVVTDGSNTGMPGVNVTIKGSNTGTITDLDGKYSITATTGDVLVYSFIGYVTQEIIFKDNYVLNVSLAEDIKSMDEVVVVGYTPQRKSDITGSVGVINTANFQRNATDNVSKALQGQASGVQVFGGGEPGAQQKVQIRGIGSFGNTEPLYVVDGVPISGSTSMGGAGGLNFENTASGYGGSAPSGGIADLNPSNIESITVLKDATAAAQYGARGANGVIIITTKSGKVGTAKITYDGSYGSQNIVEKMDMANRVQYQVLRNEANKNDGLGLDEANNDTSKYFIGNIDTDWQKETFKTGIVSNHNVSLSGGTEDSRYFGNVGYFDQTGTFVGKGPRFTKYSGEIKLNQKKGRLKITESVMFTKSTQIRLTSQRWNNYLTDLLMSIPTVPIHDTANIGGYGGSNQYYGVTAGNPIAFNNLPEVTFDRSRFLGNVNAEFEILKSLKYSISLSYDRSDWHNKEFLPIYFVGDKFTNPVAKLSEWRGETPSMTMEHLLNFNKLIGKSDVALVGGYTVLKESSEELYGHKEGYTEPYLKQISSSTANPATLGVRNEHAMISYLGIFNYDYDKKYFATATLRRDYSSNFGPQNKYGDFPAFTLGYRISNEEFFKDALPSVNILKFKGGWGKIGNEAIGAYLYETSVNNAATYYFGGILQPGVTQTRFRDPSVKWEERITSYVGFDLAMFNNKLDFTAEYYKNDANDILYANPLPVSSGIGGWSVDAANVVSMTNQGLELGLGYKNYEGELHYELRGNITTLQNEVRKLGSINTPIINTASNTEVGYAIGDIYGFKTEGIFQDSLEINIVAPGDIKIRKNSNGTKDTIRFEPSKHAFQTVKTEAGDVRFKDLNGDSIIDDNDRAHLGSVFPKFTYGFNISVDYKWFDLSIFIQGIYGNKVYNQLYKQVSALGKEESNYTVASINNRWTGPNTSNSWPRATIYDYNDNNRVSDRWVQDGSYIRLQNLTLGFTVPKTMTSKFGIDNFKIYIQGQNLLTFTKLWGFDPDFINDGKFNRGFYNGSIPTPRTFTVGVKLTL